MLDVQHQHSCGSLYGGPARKIEVGLTKRSIHRQTIPKIAQPAGEPVGLRSAPFPDQGRQDIVGPEPLETDLRRKRRTLPERPMPNGVPLAKSPQQQGEDGFQRCAEYTVPRCAPRA